MDNSLTKNVHAPYILDTHWTETDSMRTTDSMRGLTAIPLPAGTFRTLVAAMKAADLWGALQSRGPFTLFAPTDAAFARLPKRALEALLADKTRLSRVLGYHVLPRTVLAAQMVAAGRSRATSLTGQELDIEARHGRVYVNGTRVVRADIPASNGVIHVIDAVVMPKA